MNSRHITGGGREPQKPGLKSNVGHMTRLIGVPFRKETFRFRVMPFDAFLQPDLRRRVVDGNARS